MRSWWSCGIKALERSRASAAPLPSFFPHTTHTTTSLARSMQRGGGPVQRRLFSQQSSLPRLPVPPLADTAERYLKSLEPVLLPDELRHSKECVEDFLKGEGPALQAKLEARATNEDNWLERWWDDGYFSARDPLVIGTNPALLMDDPEQLPQIAPARVQAWRAAQATHAAMTTMLEIYSETLEPEPDACMSQYARVFATARVPGAGGDQIINYKGHPPTLPTRHYKMEYKPSDPRHVVVMSRGKFFAVKALGADGASPRPVAELEAAFQGIIDETTKGSSAEIESAKSPGIFTAIDRDAWAAARDCIQSESSSNARSLERVQSALLLVSLDPEAPMSYTDHAFAAMCGSDGHSRWCDKHVLIVFANGKAALNFEHGVCDGLPWTRVLNEISSHPTFEEAPSSTPPLAIKPNDPIPWDLGCVDRAVAAAEAAYALHRQGTDLTTLKFDEFGRSDIKAMGVSPDGFVQMAIQLAYFRLFGMCVPTYESASTRAFVHGRTETLRSCTSESRLFVSSMDSPSIHSERKRVMQRALLRQAVAAHSKNIRNATKGHGVDRHLLGLRLIAQESGIETPAIFKDPAYGYSGTWQLSTSSMPTNEIVAWGAVCDAGYGVYYCMPTRYTGLNFMISSYHGNERPASQFQTALTDALRDIAALLRSEKSANL